MRSTLNAQGVVYPADERFGASATKLGFQLKLKNVAAGPFSFRLNVLGGPDLPWSHDLVVINKEHGRATSLQQLFDLGEFALLYLWCEAVVASFSNSVSLIGDHHVNHAHVRVHVAIEVTDLCCPTGTN